MKKTLFALSICLFCFLQPLRSQLVDSLTVNEIVSRSSTVIRGTASVRECPECILVYCVCTSAIRQNDRVRISGNFPPCDLATSKVNYTICDSIIIADIVLQASDKQHGAPAIEVDFGPCTADNYTLYARYNGSSPISFSTDNYNSDICADGYTAFPLGRANAVGQVSILTPDPKVGQPVMAQVGLDYYKGVDNLTITSVNVNSNNYYNVISLFGSCSLGMGSSTQAVTTVCIDSIPYPGNYDVVVYIDGTTEGQTLKTEASCSFKVTADDGWHDPRTMDYFLNNILFSSSIEEDKPFTISANWGRLTLSGNKYDLPTMQLDSLSDHKAFISVHYDTTVDVPNDYNSSYSKVTVPGLKGGPASVVFTGVDEAGHHDYPPCERTFDVDYHQYTGTITVGDASRPTDEEGRNDLIFHFEGDSLHVQGLLWMRCESKQEVQYNIHGHDIRFHPTLGNSRKATARFPVDFYLSPCPFDDYTIYMYGVYYKNNQSMMSDTFYVARQPDSSIWADGSQWDVVYYDSESDNGSDVEVERVTYSLRQAEDGYLALEKTVSVDGVTSDAEVQGYIRNDHDTLIYVRPVLADGTIGEECLLYDFRKPYEYGGTVRYGVLGGEVVEERIDWNAGTLDYFMLKGGDKHCLPAWKDIIYGYGCLGGPMELFMQSAAPQKKGQPKPTNISHVIFTTKGGQKTIHMRGEEDEQEIEIPYDEMLQTGTVWECLEVSAEEPDCMHTYTIQVQGDVMIAGRLCKQVYSLEKETQLTLFEEGRKVYIVNADETPEVLFDFGLQRGDILADESCVIYTDMIQNQGYDYRRIGIDTNLDCRAAFADDTTPWSYDLIEGIGVSKDEHLPGQRPFSEQRTISYLLCCWRGNTLVYQSSAYDYLTGINALRLNTETPLYDLQGRPTSHPAPGIYIQNGHKVVVR